MYNIIFSRVKIFSHTRPYLMGGFWGLTLPVLTSNLNDKGTFSTMKTLKNYLRNSSDQVYWSMPYKSY